MATPSGRKIMINFDIWKKNTFVPTFNFLSKNNFKMKKNIVKKKEQFNQVIVKKDELKKVKGGFIIVEDFVMQ